MYLNPGDMKPFILFYFFKFVLDRYPLARMGSFIYTGIWDARFELQTSCLAVRRANTWPAFGGINSVE